MRAWVTSRRHELRLTRARDFLHGLSPSAEALIVGPSFEAAAELTRSLKRPIFGWRRSTLWRLAIEVARPVLLERQLTPLSGLALDAVWVRVCHQLAQADQLHRFEPVAGSPGLPRAMAQTVAELRMLGVSWETVEPGLGQAMRLFEETLEAARCVDRAQVFQLAAEQLTRASAVPLLLVDVVAQPGFEQQFLSTLIERSASVLAVSPADDVAMAPSFQRALGAAQVLQANEDTALGALQQRLFSESASAHQHRYSLDDIFSAPGEARECAEIARRILHFAQSGTPFDQMAVLLRSPESYRDHLAEALQRAKIPVWFDFGLTRPDPAGRAFLALLQCAEEGLSARRLSEYLSLAQVPAAEAPVPGEDLALVAERENSLLPLTDWEPEVQVRVEAPIDPEAAVVLGQLRAPRRWERLIIDAAVIGGTDRWRRRLSGLRQQKLKERSHPHATESQQARLDRELADLKALEDFALPILDLLAALPARAIWAEWLAALVELAQRALRRPERVLAVLHELAPMGTVGPVTLPEVCATLSARLLKLTVAPEGRRHGHVLVASVEAGRGLSVAVCFVPGLAERVFPQKIREDPLLSDSARQGLHPELEVAKDRIARERLALLLSVGAAQERAILSYPRLDAEQGRARVPSFYALEAARAVQGELPGYEALQRQAERLGQARLAWPAPPHPAQAIDETEYDLALFGQLLASQASLPGRARYLVKANPHVARALRARYARWQQSTFTAYDGLVKIGATGRAALAAHQFDARPYSPTSLEQYAACPYRFYLSAILRLHPLEIPGELQELGPLEKGSMAHQVQFELLSALRSDGLKVTHDSLSQVLPRLRDTVRRVSAQVFDDLKPAIERIWLDGLAVLEADLRQWLVLMAQDAHWWPAHFELSFGLPGKDAAEQDPASSPSPVTLVEGLKVRGSIDLVEQSVDGRLRATDYKTGRVRAQIGNVIGGGRHVQPLLYALVLEQLFPSQAIEGGRFYYTTQVGGFESVPTPLDATSREAFGAVVRTLRRSLEEGFFPAAPDDEECRYCSFRPVCGPDEERRLKRTRKAAGAELQWLRQLRAMR